eukprot:TRINITY_DN23044_c0_g1_i1.p1 TRINITY_DN23044_c0_g1~~TRINITY_DN23044_c0_g1_i1.p1  ORF type:complete len:254 (-),score=57.69 TRINITY_DN23044_c0_g1_i1:100-804(-)
MTLHCQMIPVPDLDFDADLAILTPVPDCDFDADLMDPEDEEDAPHVESESSATPQFFEIADDSDEELSNRRCSPVSKSAPASSSTSSSTRQQKPRRLSERATSFVEWLRWRRPFLRFEGMSKGLAWEYPLAKSEKRELLLLVMLGAERDMQKGTHDDCHNVIATAAAAQQEAGAKLVSIARGARPSFKAIASSTGEVEETSTASKAADVPITKPQKVSFAKGGPPGFISAWGGA